MVGTIAPLVKEARRQWLVSIVGFTVASTAAGASLGLILGVGALVVHGNAWFQAVVIAGAGLMLVVADAGTEGHVWSLGRSVPQGWWRTMGPTRGALSYGLVLGLGFTTIVPFATFYVIPISALVLGPIAGGLIGGAYGLGRALPVWVASMFIGRGADPVVVGDWALHRWQRLFRGGIGLSTATIAAGLLGSLV